MNASLKVLKPKNPLQISELKKNFNEIFSQLDRSKSRFQVFSDFITCSAIAYQNHAAPGRASYSEKLESEYMAIVGKYPKADVLQFPVLLNIIVELLEAYGSPHDVIGDMYMSFDFGSKYNAQHFTPIEISNLMAEIADSSVTEMIQKNGFITVSDPACGAGSTLLAKVNKVIDKGFNPAKTLYIEGVDIDRLCALMCFIQMTLWNVPARIFVGDTLQNTKREVWITTAYMRGNWASRLNHYRVTDPQITTQNDH